MRSYEFGLWDILISLFMIVLIFIMAAAAKTPEPKTMEIAETPIPEIKVEVTEPTVDIPIEIPEDIYEEVIEPEVEEEPPVLYFDVPLSEDLQDHIFLVCESYGLDPALIIAVIQRESTYRAKLMGDNGKSYGLMQIQKKWHLERMERLGVTNLLDPYQNVKVGIDYLAELSEMGRGIEWTLMAYNGGPSYANKNAARGIVSNYAKDILTNINNLERGI